MKIIASDYDGTLNFGGITPEKLSAIEKWRKAGNLFCIVSGRQKDFHLELKENEIPFDYLLSCNGAVITDSDYNTVSDIRCEENIGKGLVEYLFALGCPFTYVCKNDSFRIKNTDYPDEEGILLSEVSEIPWFNQISTALDTFEEAAVITEKINEKFGSFTNALQNGVCIDIVPSGIDKAVGIYRLLEITGAGYPDVIAVGDNINDEAMIKEFYSYAMANGIDYIKALADNVISGIEELIEKES